MELHIVMTMSYVKRSPIPQLIHPAVTSHRYDMIDVKRSFMQQRMEANVISHRYDMSDAKWNEKISHSPPKKRLHSLRFKFVILTSRLMPVQNFRTGHDR
jgi:hypothetical protein